MTPTELLQEYRNLDVPLFDGRTMFWLDIHEYRNATTYYKGLPASGDHGIHAGMAAKEALLRVVKAEGEKVTSKDFYLYFGADGKLIKKKDNTTEVQACLLVNTVELLQPFQGKGSPDQIRTVLKIAVACGLVQPQYDAMQKYCDDHIGLDCNGFVGNYVRAEGHSTLGPSTYIPSFASTGTKRTAISEIKAKDVMVFKDGSHITAIDSITNSSVDSFECYVAESCGSSTIKGDKHTDGLNTTHYTVKSVSKDKVFSVKRGRGWEQASAQNLMSVYIV